MSCGSPPLALVEWALTAYVRRVLKWDLVQIFLVAGLHLHLPITSIHIHAVTHSHTHTLSCSLSHTTYLQIHKHILTHIHTCMLTRIYTSMGTHFLSTSHSILNWNKPQRWGAHWSRSPGSGTISPKTPSQSKSDFKQDYFHSSFSLLSTQKSEVS